MNTVIKIRTLNVNMCDSAPSGLGVFANSLEQFATPTAAAETPVLEWSATLLDGKRVSRKEAEEAVKALGDGWRLPTRTELLSIVDDSRHKPAIDTTKFPDTKSEPYWTCTPCAWDESARWVVGFYYGGVGYLYVAYAACVRACRASQ